MLLVLGATASAGLSARTVGSRKPDKVSQAAQLIVGANETNEAIFYSHWKRKIKSLLMSCGDS